MIEKAWIFRAIVLSVTKEMVRKADLILVMESAHKIAMKKMIPAQKEKFFAW